MQTIIKSYYPSLWMLVALLSCASCSKLVAVDPPNTSINGDNVFNENSTAIAVLTGIYSNMSTSLINSTGGSLTNIGFLSGLTGDEFKLFNPTDGSFGLYYNNDIPATDNTWQGIYNIIFIVNDALEKLPQSNGLTPSVRNQLIGEARFMRAFCYFYLVNLYGDVPLALTTDYTVTRILPRTSTVKVYQQVIADLEVAQSLLSNQFVGGDAITSTIERVRPTAWAAKALISRVFLYVGDYAQAEAQATQLIENNNGLFHLTDLDNTFLSNSPEAIWQLQPVGLAINNKANTADGVFYNLLPLFPGNYIVYLNENLLKSFDSRDLRHSHWIGSLSYEGQVYYFPYKYKAGFEPLPTREYATVLRLSEQYLIRAEARIRQGNNIPGGLADLNTVRDRATDHSVTPSMRLPPWSLDLSRDEALFAVEQERRWEFFSEWGHRWLDLKRTARIDAVLSTIKPGYQATDQLFPIPQADINLNPSLVGHQNPGYH